MKNISLVTALFFLVILGCQKQKRSTIIQQSDDTIKAEQVDIKTIRKQLELVNLGLLTMLDDQLFISLVDEMSSTPSQKVRTIDISTAYKKFGTTLEDVLYEKLMSHSEEDLELTLAVVEAFKRFEISEFEYFPTIEVIGRNNSSIDEIDVIPEYIVNQEDSSSDLFYGYLKDGNYTYMKKEQLSILKGWVIQGETINNKRIFASK